MLEAFLAQREKADFDFREFACADDPLRYLFDEWVDYYRDKFAIATALAPRSILEIGVRYGYSAIAFLKANPEASYVGLDNDSPDFGGNPGALEWARGIMQPYRARIEIADSQLLSTLPGEEYDLVHVDGQQDGDGTYHDLELALEKARWILVDGLFWSNDNMFASAHFLRKYSALIEYAIALPGYAGELLIKVKENSGFRPPSRRTRDYRALRQSYSDSYFLRDCGGYAAFKSTGGRQLLDARLVTLRDLGEPWQGRRVLDVGSGRGELSYACFAAGADVTGVDYSEAAVRLAHSTYAAEVGERLRFVCEDILRFQPEGRFDTIVAADFVEHLAPADLDRALQRMSGWLAPGGRLLVHTWPNRICYEGQQSQRRKAAKALGIFVPANQRSLYEDEMHLNEQTPARLKRALARHFAHALVWVGNERDPHAGLGRMGTRQLLETCDSIYAVAAHEAVDAAEIRTKLVQERLPEDVLSRIHVEPLGRPARVRAGASFEVQVRVRNDSGSTIASRPPHPVHLSYHWLIDGRIAVFDGLRTALGGPLKPGESRSIAQRIAAPPGAGSYQLVLALVQEGVRWLDQPAADSSKRIDGVAVRGATSPANR